MLTRTGQGEGRVIRAEKFVRGVFFLDRLEGSRFGHQKNHPQWKYPPKTQDGRLDVLELRQLFAQLHFELRPEELHLGPSKKNSTFWGDEMVMNLRMGLDLGEFGAKKRIGNFGDFFVGEAFVLGFWIILSNDC